MHDRPRKHSSTEYFLSGGATTYDFIVDGATSVSSFVMRSTIPRNVVVPQKTRVTHKSPSSTVQLVWWAMKDLWRPPKDGSRVQSEGWYPVAWHRKRPAQRGIWWRAGDHPPLPRQAERGSKGRHLRSRVLKSTLAGLDFVDDTGDRGGGGSDMGEKCSKEETEKSQASARADTPRGTQTSAGRGRGRGRARNLCRSGPVFSSAGEMAVNSATAEKTMSPIALWRRTLSPPPQERAWSPDRPRTSPHVPLPESRSQPGIRIRGRRWRAT